MKVRKKIRSLIDKAMRVIAKGGKVLKSLWSEHLDRMSTDPAYAQAVRQLFESAGRVFKTRAATGLLAEQFMGAYLMLLGLRRPKIRVVPGIYI